jgi:hypothetical protein
MSMLTASDIGPDDKFAILLRRKGWHLQTHRSVYNDSQVIRWRPIFGPYEGISASQPFSSYLGNNTFRKILRAILTSPRDMKFLGEICTNHEKLIKILALLEAGGIAVRDGELWTKGPGCEGIDNTGPTLEWYVAEWFRRELEAPARHGVTIQEVPRGGDLDVVAFVNDLRIMVECKTGRPENISDIDMRWFLQRAYDFKPEIAVMLIDTESSVSSPANLATKIVADLSRKSRNEELSNVDNVLAATFPKYPDLYWCASNVFVTNVKHGIDGALSALLRLYDTHVRHQLYTTDPMDEEVWDFVQGQVQRREGEPQGVEGQVWLP